MCARNTNKPNNPTGATMYGTEIGLAALAVVAGVFAWIYTWKSKAMFTTSSAGQAMRTVTFLLTSGVATFAFSLMVQWSIAAAKGNAATNAQGVTDDADI